MNGENFHRFYKKVVHELRFFDKIEGCMLRGCKFIKMLVHHRVFSQNIIFKAAIIIIIIIIIIMIIIIIAQ